MLTTVAQEDETPLLDAPPEAEDIVCDYASVGLTLGRQRESVDRAKTGAT
jgi:error-prone DNA polymerase